MIGCLWQGEWRKDRKKKRAKIQLYLLQGVFSFAFSSWFSFKTAASSLLLNWVLFLANSIPSQSRARGNCRDRLQSLQSNTWEIIDWASVRLVFFPTLSLFPRVFTMETKSIGMKKRSESISPFTGKALYRWSEEPNCLAPVWAKQMWKWLRNSCGLSLPAPKEMYCWRMKTHRWMYYVLCTLANASRPHFPNAVPATGENKCVEQSCIEVGTLELESVLVSLLYADKPTFFLTSIKLFDLLRVCWWATLCQNLDNCMKI